MTHCKREDCNMLAKGRCKNFDDENCLDRIMQEQQAIVFEKQLDIQNRSLYKLLEYLKTWENK